MSDVDEQSAQKLAVLIVAMLAFATVLVLFSCYRIVMEKRMRRKQQPVAPIAIEPIRIPNVVNPMPLDATTTQQSDNQLIFGSLNTLTTTSSAINQTTVIHCPLTEIQNEYERRALERRAHLGNKESTLPPYSSEDDSLPSYDQVVRSPINDNT